jgi:hypothetical protein
VAAIKTRIGDTERLQYEKFFARYYPQLNEDELFDFAQIRGITEGSLFSGNRKTLEILEDAPPELFDTIPLLKDLRQHLVFWLNKYDRVFLNRKDMCVLYAGVEDGVPFPPRLNETLDAWLRQQE